MNIRPLGDKVIVERLEAEAVTAGGIVLPDSAKEKPKRGGSSASATENCSMMAPAARCN